MLQCARGVPDGDLRSSPGAALVLVVLPPPVTRPNECAGEDILAVAGIETAQAESGFRRSARHLFSGGAGQRLLVAPLSVSANVTPIGLALLVAGQFEVRVGGVADGGVVRRPTV